jgi:hypothetical protein
MVMAGGLPRATPPVHAARATLLPAAARGGQKAANAIPEQPTMSETPLNLHDAALRLGVPVRTLRHAIRAGKLPAPPSLSASAAVPADWLANIRSTLEASHDPVRNLRRPKVPAFARFEGTSFFTKFRVRARAYRRFRAGAQNAAS